MIPVVLIHKGKDKYLDYALLQACDKNDVRLISDQQPGITHPKLKVFPLDLYSNKFREFEENYVHLNTTPYHFEVFCYHRWFILRNFMEQNNLNTVFYIDSDVMLYADVNAEWSKFQQYTMTLLHRTAAVSSFITLEGLRNFCDMLEDIYSNRDQYPFQKIASHYHTRQACGLGGGVCDMTLFEYFHYDAGYGGGPGKVGEMMQVIDDSTYDHNINAADQFEINNDGTKAITLIDRQPHVYHTILGRPIRFNSLHFQGSAKSLMGYHYSGPESI